MALAPRRSSERWQRFPQRAEFCFRDCDVRLPRPPYRLAPAPCMSELCGQDLRPTDQRCDRGGPSKSAVLRLEVIQDLRDQTVLDGLRRSLHGTGMLMNAEWHGEGRRK